MKKKWYLILFSTVFLLASISLSAQSNDILDELLDEEEATFGKTAYLTLLAADLIPEDASIEQALSVLDQQGWGIAVKGANQPITLGEYSYLLMRALDIPGGLMYRVAPGTRYAFRELSFLGLVVGKVRPNRKPSGEEVVQMLSGVLDWKEEWS